MRINRIFSFIDDLSFFVTETRVPGIGGRLVKKHVTVVLMLVGWIDGPFQDEGYI